MWPSIPPNLRSAPVLVPDGVTLECGCKPQEGDFVHPEYDTSGLGEMTWRHRRCGTRVGARREMRWDEMDQLGKLGHF